VLRLHNGVRKDEGEKTYEEASSLAAWSTDGVLVSGLVKVRLYRKETRLVSL
jgi:hypothetical protein